MNKTTKIILSDLLVILGLIYLFAGLMSATVIIMNGFDSYTPLCTKILGISFMVVVVIIVIGGWILSINNRSKGR